MLQSEEWPAILEQTEANVKQARKAGDFDAMITATQAALQLIEARLAGLQDALPDVEKTKTLQAIKRIGYNVAADIYPGWEEGTPPRSDAQLNSATGFAQKSAAAAAQLDAPPAQRGNAVWLLAALDMARGDMASARTGFEKAAEVFGTAEPELQLMAQGYAGIAGNSITVFEAAMAGLKNLGSEDATETREQLEIASRIFALRA